MLKEFSFGGEKETEGSSLVKNELVDWRGFDSHAEKHLDNSTSSAVNGKHLT